MSKVKTAKKLFDSLSKTVKGLDKVDAEKILAKIDTPEKAIALRGAEREEYLKALDAVYGDTETRIPQVLSDNNIKGFHGTPKQFEGEAINLNKSGENTGVNTANSFSITTDPRLASEYADWGIDSGNNIIPVRVNTSNLITRDAVGRQIKNSIRSKIIDNAAEVDKKDGVLFKNLLDDPNEYIQKPADIVFVTNPNIVRSEFAAFDPRFKNNPLLMAGAAGAAVTMLPEEGEASVAGGYKGLKNIMKIGDSLVHVSDDGTKTLVKHPMQPKTRRYTNSEGRSFELANDVEFGGPEFTFDPTLRPKNADEMQDIVKSSLEDTNVLPDTKVPKNGNGGKKGAAALLGAGLASGKPQDLLAAPAKDLMGIARMYRENVADPIADAIKARLTPDVNVGGKTYQTSSPVSDLVVDVGYDPLNAVSGGAGLALGALDAASSMNEEEKAPNFNELRKILKKK